MNDNEISIKPCVLVEFIVKNVMNLLLCFDVKLDQKYEKNERLKF